MADRLRVNSSEYDSSASWLSDWYPLGQGSRAKSEFDMLEVSRNPLRLMTSLPESESDTPKSTFYNVHFTARKCSNVCARSLASHTISDWECHIMRLIVKLLTQPAPACTACTDQRNLGLSMTRVYHCIAVYHPQPPHQAVLAYLKIIHHSKDPFA